MNWSETSKLVFALLLFVVLVCLLLPKLRAARPIKLNNGTSKLRIRAFLRQNPSIARDLKARPTLIGDKDYLGQHPNLEALLRKCPEAKEQLLTTNRTP
jgi:hypothetical protein